MEGEREEKRGKKINSKKEETGILTIEQVQEPGGGGYLENKKMYNFTEEITIQITFRKMMFGTSRGKRK